MRYFIYCLTALLASLAPLRADSTLHDGDTFEMLVGGAPREFTEEFHLQYSIADGYVTVQYIGRVKATGLTPAQLATAIEKRLREEKIFTNPTVMVNLPPNQRMIIVGGAVRNPGRQLWATDMTLSIAIASASGPGEYADDKIKIVRNGKAEFFSRRAIKKDPAIDPKVLPGDYIEVQGEL